MIVYQFQQASIEHPDRCEDAILISSNVGHAPVFAIIDGMGGHKHELADGRVLTGRDAALLIHDVLIEDLEHFEPTASADPDSETERQLLAGISRAHAKLFSDLNGGEGLSLRERLGAVLTTVVVCEEGKRLLVAQVGDSRAYVYSDEELIQLCPDEDNIEHLVRRQLLSARDAEKISAVLNTYDGVNEPTADGVITLGGQVFELYMAWRWFLVGNQALNIPASNVVINSMGTHEADPIAEKSRIEIGAGDILLLCSDGLYKNLSEAEIINGLHSADSDDPAKVLGEAALARSQDSGNNRRNPDDISVIVVKF